jgi:adenylate cyclase class 2
MGASRRETEIKLRFPTAEAALDCLGKAGARALGPREREDNVLYDLASHPLQREGSALRLRRVGGRAMLTLKTSVAGMTAHKVRLERETIVGDPDALHEILGYLGFFPVYRYEKYRTSFALDDVVACLDETPLGCFVELEGEPDSIDRVATRIGFFPRDYIRASYRELHRNAVAAGSARPGDLLLQDEGAGSRP